MKNILIVVAIVAICGTVGFFGTAMIARAYQPSLDNLSEALDSLSHRQNYAMIGGGIGILVGLILGFLAARINSKKKSASE